MISMKGQVERSNVFVVLFSKDLIIVLLLYTIVNNIVYLGV